MTTVQDIGDLRRCSATFTDLSGAVADPTTVMVTTRDPSGISTPFSYGIDVELVRDGVGMYHIDITPTISGRYAVTWMTTGVPQLSESAEFHVKRRSI